MYRSKRLFFISGYTLMSAGKLAAREGLMALGGEGIRPCWSLVPSLPVALKSSLACWRKSRHGVSALLSGRTTLTSGKLLLAVLILL